MTTAAVQQGAGNLALHVSSSDGDLPLHVQPPNPPVTLMRPNNNPHGNANVIANVNPSGAFAGSSNIHPNVLSNAAPSPMVRGAPQDAGCAPKMVPKIPDSPIDDSIDSALLAALRDPRERLGLLKLEQVMMDFMNPQHPKYSQDAYLDIGGPYNSVVISPSHGVLLGGSNLNTHTGSGTDGVTCRPQTTFQRCILHRLADRFRIARDQQVNGYIRLIKLPESAPPKKRLLDLDPSEYAPMDEKMEQMTISNNNSNTKNPKPRKMKIMKRNSSNVSNASGDANKSTAKNKNRQNTLSEKEKKYAEARARIFQEEQQAAKQQDVHLAAHKPTAAAASTMLAPPMVATMPTPTTYITPTDQDESSQYSNNANSSRPSKATWRNRHVEQNDPDFQRGQGIMSGYYNHNQNNMIGYGYGNPAASAHPPPPQDYYTTAQAQSQAAQAGYYGGRGGGGGGQGTNLPMSVTGTTNTRTYVSPQQYNYRRAHSAGEAAPAVHSLEDFPSLR